MSWRARSALRAGGGPGLALSLLELLLELLQQLGAAALEDRSPDERDHARGLLASLLGLQAWLDLILLGRCDPRQPDLLQGLEEDQLLGRQRRGAGQIAVVPDRLLADRPCLLVGAVEPEHVLVTVGARLEVGGVG